jgi:subtilisin family serine protease
MPKVKGKEQLCSCEKYTTYFKSIQGLGGYTLFDRYDAIENVVNTRIDEKYRHFLAQPIIEGDSIIWFSKPFNETPQRLSELKEDEYTKYEQIKNITLSHFNSTIQTLKQEGKTSEAEFLQNAIKFINDDFVFCFDGITVLGIWGMQLRDNVRLSIGIAVKIRYAEKKKPQPNPETPIDEGVSTDSEKPPEKPASDNQPDDPKEPPVNPFKVRFNEGDNGEINGPPELSKRFNDIIDENEVPEVKAREGYEFIGWDKDPNNHSVDNDIEFTAKYRIIPPAVTIPPSLPWYQKVWNWLHGLFMGRNCLKWLLWLLLLVLLLLLFCWLFRSCNNASTQIPYPIGDKPWINDDPNVGKGGIYNPGDPYKPAPTPPEYKDVLPPYQGVLPPIDSSRIIREPGNPTIIDNRLNILMENEGKSIMDLAKDFKAKYPEEKYKVVYYDEVVKRMQIEVPKEERATLKQEIPLKLSPEYELFVFDEALFESNYTPNDPAFSDPNKSWYLQTIKAPQGWDITRGSRKLTVAIVDNSFSLNHPELSSKVVMPYNVWGHSKDVFAQQVDHGTHVAGTALAIIDNGKGICGIAPECAFMPVQVANQQGLMTTTSVLDGVLYALYQGADVINVSLGMEFNGTLPEQEQRNLQDNRFKEEERLWNEVMKISAKHKAIIVVAAGNNNMLAGINPINRPKNFVIVSAVDKKNQPYQKTGFSNYGDYSTISAPGVDIYSSVGNNDYAAMDGTSMASPIVAGSIALMKSLNEDLSPEQIICILQSTGIPSNGKIGNMIQLDKALQKVQSGDFKDCGTRPETPSTGEVQLLLSWNNYNDLDLACIDPEGNAVWYKNKRVPSGGFLEIDMNVDPNDSNTPIENIYWQQGGAPNGTYEVYLWFYKQHEPAIEETPYTITVKHGIKNEVFTGKIKKDDGRVRICTFTLGNTNSPRNPDNPNNPPVSNKRRDDLLKERERLQRQLNEVERQLH